MKKKVVFISSITSDIGMALAKRYAQEGYALVGTYRHKNLLPELKSIKDIHLIHCDLGDGKSVQRSIEAYRRLRKPWDIFISLAAQPQPLQSFFKCHFKEWEKALHINAIEQLRTLHAIYPLRDKKKNCDVIFFAGPGTNNAPKNFSAAVLSKIMLIKMCELLDAENKDLNVFIVGPGWTKTKTHELYLKDKHISMEKRQEVLNFLHSKEGTSMEDIYDCLCWLSSQGKEVAGGRNFSVVHDPWKGPSSHRLAAALKKDAHMYKLRRYKNNLLTGGGFEAKK